MKKPICINGANGILYFLEYFFSNNKIENKDAVTSEKNKIYKVEKDGI
ncbi:MAG: hypothetical protein SPF70_10270 [Lachnospiraceae bacterium]|nr:hypothetical protein [Lachnospiraceae bacterium]